MVVDGVFYPNYPYIRQNDIGSNTSNMFVDSVRMCNLFLNGIGGDYDGDTTSNAGLYSIEANEEAERVMKSKFNLIGLGGTPIREAGNEAFQALYSLTLVLPDAKDKIQTPTFGKA